eukprot:TRINITY_DN19855_c0_g2_i1.p1 TRINITY_DN19855_c0_g2~~TRINITY_DN19855_c0_g2_i1.p1  ORF type:complete len:375 (+),score=53.88 TRINITY_DN19855_c0_g2_i1:52-1125(+)
MLPRVWPLLAAHGVLRSASQTTAAPSNGTEFETYVNVPDAVEMRTQAAKQIEAGVNQSMADMKLSLDDGLNADTVSASSSGTMRLTNNDILLGATAKFNAEREYAINQNEAATAYSQKFIQTCQELIDVETERANKATDARAVLQTQIGKLTNSMQMYFCKPPAEDTVPWNGNARDHDNRRKYETFELAWQACGQTPGCGHVMKLEGDKTKLNLADPSPFLTASGVQAFLDLEGYYIAPRSDPALDSQVHMGTVVANGDSACDKVQGWWDATFNGTVSMDANTVTEMLQAMCDVLVLRNVEYSCPALCPSSCVAPVGGTICMNCAAANRTCVGTSGACAADTIDCRNCNSDTSLVQR